MSFYFLSELLLQFFVGHGFDGTETVEAETVVVVATDIVEVFLLEFHLGAVARDSHVVVAADELCSTVWAGLYCWHRVMGFVVLRC